MLFVNNPMFLLIPDNSGKRVLHPGKVLEANKEFFVAEFEEAVAPELNLGVNIFSEVRGKFFQQAATVAEIRTAGPNPIIGFHRVGEAVSAEQRQMYRVVAVSEGILANLDKERNCAVVDISPAGFSCVAKGTYPIGSHINVHLNYEGETIAAAGQVQTVKIRPDGKMRYGIFIPHKTSPARKWLEQTSAAMQRLHLRRLAGAA